MMTTPSSPRIGGAEERREHSRFRSRTSARMDWPSRLSGPTSAVIADSSACGLRVASEVRPDPGEAVTLRPAGHRPPLHARVAWVERREPLGWEFGCRLDGASIGKFQPGLAPIGRARPPGTLVRRIAGVLGTAALLALIAWFIVRFAMVVGGGAYLWKRF